MDFFINSTTDPLLEKALRNERLSAEDALKIYRESDFLKVMFVAGELRKRQLSSNFATYTLFHVVNYTNRCNIGCSFCSFMEEVQDDRGYCLTDEQLIERLKISYADGNRQLFLQGGVDPNLPFDYYLNLLTSVKREFGREIHIRGFSPVEILNMVRITGTSLGWVLQKLKDAGLDSLPGAGAEILSDRVRSILSPAKASVEDWVSVLEEAHAIGLYGSANIVFGTVESDEEIIKHLQIVRDLQDRTHGVISFVLWTFQQQTQKFKTRVVGAHEYLKTLGVARIFLDNIKHIETSVMVLGPGVGTLALHAGADDISSVVIEENVLRNHAYKTEEKTRDYLRTSGFRPLRRDFNYNIVETIDPLCEHLL